MEKTVLKTYRYYYRSVLGINRVITNKNYSVFRSLKNLPYDKMISINKCYINDRLVPDVYLKNQIDRCIRWHEKRKLKL